MLPLPFLLRYTLSISGSILCLVVFSSGISIVFLSTNSTFISLCPLLSTFSKSSLEICSDMSSIVLLALIGVHLYTTISYFFPAISGAIRNLAATPFRIIVELIGFLPPTLHITQRYTTLFSSSVVFVPIFSS